MLNRLSALCALTVAGTMLSGCLGGTPSVLDAAALAELVVDTRSNTAPMLLETTTVPQNETATYRGYMGGVIKDPGSNTRGTHYVGNAAFDVRFTNQDIAFSGEVTDIIARSGSELNDRYTTLQTGTKAEIEDMFDGYDTTTGTIRFADGKFVTGGVNPTQVTSKVSGGFTHEGTDYAFGGATNGYLFGADGEGLNVNAETSDRLTLTANGAAREGDFATVVVKE